MSYILFSLLLLATIGLAITSTRGQWDHFKQTYNKIYKNGQEESMRRTIFERRRAEVEEINRLESEGSLTFRAKINQFSDRTEDELAKFRGLKVQEGELEIGTNPSGRKYLDRILSSRAEIPEELDWRQWVGRVSDVKEQGSCGSCWAFSAIGTLEGQMAVRNSNLMQLSEQNLLDCSRHNDGCSGGLFVNAWNDIGALGGIGSSWMYPYKAGQQNCTFNRKNAVFNSKGGTYLTSGDEEELKRVVALYGPVSIGYDAHRFTFDAYSSGVYYEENCHNTLGALNHAMVVVGYGVDLRGGPYWICKNSWGKRFGEAGYIKVARNRNNHCGIATMAAIPYFSEDDL